MPRGKDDQGKESSIVNEILGELKAHSTPRNKNFIEMMISKKKGGLGEKDIVLGTYMPPIRSIVAKYIDKVDDSVIETLLHSPIHEMRATALLLMVGNEAKDYRKMYLANTTYVNSWDLVDMSAPFIMGRWLFKEPDKGMAQLEQLARSTLLWERRIALVSTLFHIRHGDLGVSIAICKFLIHDKEVLIQKAVGWILKEVGKKDKPTLRAVVLENKAQLSSIVISYMKRALDK